MADQRLRFVRLQVAWMLATIVTLVAAERFSLVGFYVISVIGFFVVTEVTATEGVRPRWRRRIRVVGVVLTLGFVAVVALEVFRIVAGP